MEDIKKLKSRYYLELTSCIFFALACLIIIIITANDSFVDETLSKYAFIVFIALMGLYSMYLLVRYLKDLKCVRSNNYKELIGKVKYYESILGFETGKQVNVQPIIQEINGDKEIKLSINDKTEKNKTYTFIYLKHTKIGVVKTKVCQEDGKNEQGN